MEGTESNENSFFSEETKCGVICCRLLLAGVGYGVRCLTLRDLRPTHTEVAGLAPATL